MAPDIFGGSQETDIDALLKRAVKARRRPGIIINHERSARLRYRGDRGNVRHFERLRPWRFDQYRPRIGFEQLDDAGADQGIEVGCFDAVSDQHTVAEFARWPIGVVAN